MPYFMIQLIPYINLLSLSWIIKCLFLRDMESLKGMDRLLGVATLSKLSLSPFEKVCTLKGKVLF